jgi:hypothetical protein
MHQPAAFFGLGRNQIADDGAAAIADALASNTCLLVLNLSENLGIR